MTNDRRLDGRAAAQPRYEQVKSALIVLIESGTYRPGSRLPSERNLSASFSVSRLTVRRALSSLVDEGLVARTDGRGWFVATRHVSEPPNRLLGFTAMAHLRGFRPSSRPISHTTRPARMDEANVLEVAPGASVVVVARLRLLDDVPIAVDRVVIPAARAPWAVTADLKDASLHAMMESNGNIPSQSQFEVSVYEADDEVASLLGVEPRRGLLLLKGRTLDQHGIPIELGWIVYHPERYTLHAVFDR
ncbi:MAG: GntR family transcriptional regulator [Acidimicrobiia bacterium]|nr:GntR family transcriptional regulator [Acidimicrobiia bacterium]